MRRGDDDGIDQPTFQHLSRIAEQSHLFADQPADRRMFIRIVIAHCGEHCFLYRSGQQVACVDGTNVANPNNAKAYFFHVVPFSSEIRDMRNIRNAWNIDNVIL